MSCWVAALTSCYRIPGTPQFTSTGVPYTAPALPVQLVGAAFTAGMVLFSGSLYALAMTGSAPVPYAAPVGGVSFMAGWVALIWAAIRGR